MLWGSDEASYVPWGILSLEVLPIVSIWHNQRLASFAILVFFDEAGHRVATQYLLATLHGDLPAERLLRYREAYSGLPGHCHATSRNGRAKPDPVLGPPGSPRHNGWGAPGEKRCGRNRLR